MYRVHNHLLLQFFNSRFTPVKLSESGIYDSNVVFYGFNNSSLVVPRRANCRRRGFSLLSVTLDIRT